jgi:hypothetical protein
MTQLQQVNLGTSSDGTGGDTNRTGFSKVNSNTNVLALQAALTTYGDTITVATALDTSAVGKRVNIALSQADIVNLPLANTCLADQVVLLRNVGAYVVTLASSTDGTDTIALSRLNPGETAMLDTNGVDTWNVLMRGRPYEDNEVTNGNLTVDGQATVSGNINANAGVIVAGNVNVSGDQAVTGRVTADSLTTEGAAIVGANLTVNGDITIGRDSPILILDDTGSNVGSAIEYRDAGTRLWETKTYGTNLTWNLGRYVNGTYAGNAVSVANDSGDVSIASTLNVAGNQGLTGNLFLTGVVLRGINSPIAVTPNTGAAIQNHGTGGDSCINSARWSNDGSYPALNLGKSRSGVIGTQAAVQAGDCIGAIQMAGSDGNDMAHDDAAIYANAEENFTTTAHGTQLNFWTCAPGTATYSNKMRLTGSGHLLVGTADDDGTNVLQIGGNVRASAYTVGAMGVNDYGTFGFTNSNGPGITAYGNSSTGAGDLVVWTKGVETARFGASGATHIAGRLVAGSTSDDGGSAGQFNGSVRAANYAINSQSAGDAGVFGFGNSNGPCMAAYGSGTNGAGSLVFRTNAIERARFSADGRLLIGVSDNEDNGLLQVGGQIVQRADYGEIRIRASSESNLNGWRIASTVNGTADGYLAIQHSNDDFGSNFVNPLNMTANGHVMVNRDATQDDGNSALQVGGLLTGYGDIISNNGSAGAHFYANGNAGTYRGYVIQSGGVNRWELSAEGTAENGSNSGANLFLNMFNDDGTVAATPLYIPRNSGNVLIRTESDDGSNVLQIGGPARAYGTFTAGASGNKTAWITSDSGAGYFQTTGEAVIGSTESNTYTALISSNVERFRIEANGNVNFGGGQGTSQYNGQGSTGAHFEPSGVIAIQSAASATNFWLSKASGYTNNTFMIFANNGPTVGSVTTDGNSVSFNTTSDYRLKENVIPLADGIERLMTAKPSRFNFIADADKTTVDGFLAHEIAEVVPNAVSGEKDAIEYYPVFRDGYDPDNVQPDDVIEVDTVIIPQLVDNTKLVPLLTAAIQDVYTALQASNDRIAALEAKLAAQAA